MLNASTAESVSPSFSAFEKLTEFLQQRTGASSVELEPITPDASSRCYFRIPWKESSAVAAVYAEPFDPEVQPFLDVTRLMSEARIPVPQIYEADGLSGIVVQEDLGDNQLARLQGAISDERQAKYKSEAIAIIADIQAATELAYARDSIACRLAFDEAKLIWELEFFVQHYFKSLRREKLRRSEVANLMAEMNDVAAELAARPRTLCHRDYHTANLIVDAQDQVRVVDYQDARMGPATYDLVSLLLDRRTELPLEAELDEQKELFLQRRVLRKLPAIDAQEFNREFWLMSVQRCLKAAGTFANQTANFNRGAAYERFIQPMLLIAVGAAERLGRFPALQKSLKIRLNTDVCGS